MPKQRQISLLLLGAAAAGLAFLIGPPPGRGAGTLSLSIVSASTAMPSTTNFSTAQATVACPSGSTLVGGGDELTRSGSPVPNDGAVTLTPGPSERSGMRRLRDQAGTAMQGHREIYRRRIDSNPHVCDGEPLPYGLDGGELVMMGKTVANG